MTRYRDYKFDGFELYIDLTGIDAMHLRQERGIVSTYSIELSGGNSIDVPFKSIFNEIKKDWQAYDWSRA